MRAAVSRKLLHSRIDRHMSRLMKSLSIRKDGTRALSKRVVVPLLASALASFGIDARSGATVLNITVTASRGSCDGGSRPGGGCYSYSDCAGRCSGGSVPGGSCLGDANCRGGCSGHPAVLCSSNRECQCQGLGTCTSPAPGTCTDPAAGTCQGASAQISWAAVPGATGYDAVEGRL